MKKAFILVLLVVAAMIAGIYWVHRSQKTEAAYANAARAKAPITVSTATVQSQEITAKIEAVGTVDALRGAALSSAVSGVVTSVSFHSGAKVPQGTALMTLDPGALPGELAKAQAQAHLAQIDLDRERRMLSVHGTSVADFDTATANLQSAKAEVSALQGSLEQYTLRAPFAGRLGLRTIDPGDFIHAGQEIAQLEDMRDLYVDFLVPQDDAGEMHVGQPAEILLGNGQNQQRLRATVSAVGSEVVEDARALPVRALLAEPGKLIPGMFVNVQVSLGRAKRVAVIPATALSQNPYGDFVFTVTKQKNGSLAAQSQKVALGPQHGDVFEVAAGLSMGTTIVVGGQDRLVNGDAVRVNNPQSLGALR